MEALNDSGLFQIYPIIVQIVAVISNIVFLINRLKQPLAFSNFIFSILIRKVHQKEVTLIHKDFPGNSAGIESTCNAGDLGSIPRLGRSPGEGNGNSYQYSCLGNLMDRGAWQAPIHWVTKVRCDLATKPPLPPLPKLRTYSSWHNFILFLQKNKLYAWRLS